MSLKALQKAKKPSKATAANKSTPTLTVTSTSPPNPQEANFSQTLLAWGQTHGRTGLPWQCKEPYKVWLSEIMLQQTQVETVKGYYARFLNTLPTVESLANADEQTVLELWAGLGYYQRARNLQSAAKMVMSRFKGVFPKTVEQLIELPGIGPSTAAAIASICFGVSSPILDGNVQRVIGRVFGVQDDLATSAGQKVYWALAKRLMDKVPATQTQLYTQSIMDMGATVCLPKSPRCESCPFSKTCLALQSGETEKYPVKTKKKKERPFKNAHWEAVWDGESVLVLKNEEEKGVWRQMWTFPVVDADPLKQPLASLKHVFSHYDLYLTLSARRVEPDELEKIQKLTPAFKKVLWSELSKMAIPQPMNWAMGVIDPARVVNAFKEPKASKSRKKGAAKNSKTIPDESGSKEPSKDRIIFKTK